MALALADSIAEVGWDLADQADRYLAWRRSGAYAIDGRVVDVGITTNLALRRYEETGDPYRSGDPSPHASGNGSLMRLGPVPIAYARWFPDRPDEVVRRCVESSLPTHRSPACRSACAYLGVLLCGLLNGMPREQVLDPSWEAFRRLDDRYPLDPQVREVALGSFRLRQPPEIQGGGYVVRCLEAALWAFAGAADFRTAALRAVNLGDDADTTGAVCGQLAGARWGESGIPAKWRAGLAGRDLIEAVLRRLVE